MYNLIGKKDNIKRYNTIKIYNENKNVKSHDDCVNVKIN